MSLNHWLDGLKTQFATPGRRRTRTRRLKESPAAQISSEALENRLLLTTTYINAGGPALAGDPGFVADDGFENGAGRSLGRRGAIDMSGVDSNLPEAVFQGNLIDRRRAGDLQFDIPVTSGNDYQVDLLFTELQRVASREGNRIFDVGLEGDVVLDDFDIFKEAGFKKAISKSFNLTATDGNLDIDLTSVAGRAAIAGIVVTDLSDDGGGGGGGTTNTAPVISDIADQTIDQDETAGPLNFSVTDADDDSITVTTATSNPSVVASGGISVVGTGTNRTVTVTPVAGATGTAAVSLVASDGQATDSEVFTVTVNGDGGPVDPPATSDAILLNAGGSASGDFESAAGFAGTSRTFSPRRPAGVSGVPAGIPESVFQSSLFTRGRDGDLSFDIPTTAGVEYQVELLFNEPQKRASGRRIFDVSIDGQQVLNDLDIFATVGKNVALVETFTVTGDGNLDVDLSAVRNNPLISGIIVTPLTDGGGGGPVSNQAPVLAQIGSKTVTRNGTLQFTASATDADGDAITYSVNTVGLPGTPTISPTLGVFNWTPPSAGTFAVTVRASDGTDSDSETFSVTVVDGPTGNQAPVLAAIGSKTATVGNQLTFTATASDPDPGDTITYSLGPGTATGVNINSTSGVVTWTPTAAQVGAATITVTASDGSLIDTQIVSVSVTDPSSNNTAPAFGPIGDQSIQADQTLTVTPTASDANVGDTLTYSLVTSGLPGNAAVDAQTGVFTWAPPTSAIPGPFLVTLRVADQGGLSDTVSFSVTVLGSTNNAPQLDAIGNKSVTPGATLSFTATAVDADGPADTLSFFLSSDAPAAASINSGTGVFTWATSASDAGTHTFSVGVTDGTDSDSEQITVNVSGANGAPVIAAIADQTVEAGTQLSLTISATDPDAGDTLTYSLLTTGLDGNPQVDPSTGVFTWTPPFADGPGFQVTVQATDASGLSDTETFTVTVTDSMTTNSPPILGPIGAQTANVGTELSFTASATDSDIPPDTLRYLLDPAAPTGAIINSTSGVFTWTPTAQGTFTFPILVSDGTVDVSQSVTVNVGPATANQPPSFGPVGHQEVEVNQELQFTLAASDPESDTLTYSIVTTGLPGSPTVDATSGVFTWTPTQISPGFNVIVRVEDGNGGSDQFTFTVTVNDGSPTGNTSPSFNPIANQQVTAGQQLTFTVVATDPDPGTTLNYFLDPTSPSGVAVNGATGVVAWTPTAADAGTVTFPIFVDDGTVSVSASVTIVVSAGTGGGGPNAAPSFGPQNNLSIAAGSTLSTTLEAIDDDPGDTLTYVLLTTGLPGDPTINAQTGQFVWTPPVSEAGKSFQVMVGATDPGGLSDDAVFTVNVTTPGTANQAPVVNPIAEQSATVGQQLSFTISATDADGDTLSYFLDPTAPFGADVSSSGVVTWTPAADDIGTVIFPVFVSDGTTNRSANATVVVTAATGTGGGGNTSPSMAPIDNQVIDEGATLTVTPVVDDPDQGEELTFTLLTTDLPGSAVVNAQTGVFTWTPPATAGPANFSVSIRVTDSGGLTSTGTFNVQVNDTL